MLHGQVHGEEGLSECWRPPRPSPVFSGESSTWKGLRGRPGSTGQWPGTPPPRCSELYSLHVRRSCFTSSQVRQAWLGAPWPWRGIPTEGGRLRSRAQAEDRSGGRCVPFLSGVVRSACCIGSAYGGLFLVQSCSLLGDPEGCPRAHLRDAEGKIN